MKKKASALSPTVDAVIKKALKMSRAKAVREYCIDCCGGSSGDVTMCNILSCPLWWWRFGVPMSSKVAKKRMEKARRRDPQDWFDAFSVIFEENTNA